MLHHSRSHKDIAELRAAGGTSLRTIAAGLNERGIPTARGGAWTSTQVMRVCWRGCNRPSAAMPQMALRRAGYPLKSASDGLPLRQGRSGDWRGQEKIQPLYVRIPLCKQSSTEGCEKCRPNNRFCKTVFWPATAAGIRWRVVRRHRRASTCFFRNAVCERCNRIQGFNKTAPLFLRISN